MLAAKSELRTVLSEFRPGSDQLLFATYMSADSAVCDVENVLFYNVGTGAFRASSANGVSFARQRVQPPLAPDGTVYRHYHEYSFEPVPLRPIYVGAQSFTFELPDVSASTKTSDVWYRAATASHTVRSPIEGAFELHVEVTVRRPVTNVATILKTLIDGIVCAMHSDGAPSTEAVQRLAKRSGWLESEITHRLRAPGPAILGARRHLACYRDFVKWDPADHLCDACTVVVKHGVQPACTVTIFPTSSKAEQMRRYDA